MRYLHRYSSQQFRAGAALLAIFAAWLPNAASGQLLYSFESGLEGWVPSATAISVAQSTLGATNGTQTMAVEVGPNFSDDANVNADATVFNAIAATAGTGKLYDIRTDVTFTPESWDNLGGMGGFFSFNLESNSNGGFKRSTLFAIPPGTTRTFKSRVPLLEMFPTPASLGFVQFRTGKNSNHVNGTQGVSYFVDNIRIQEITEKQLFSFEGNVEGWEDGFTGQAYQHQRSIVTDYGVTSGTSAMQFIANGTNFAWGSQFLLDTVPDQPQLNQFVTDVNNGDAFRFDVTFHPDVFSVTGQSPPSFLNLTLHIQGNEGGFYQSFDKPIDTGANALTTVTIPFDELRSGALDLSSGLVSSTFFRFAIATNQSGPSAFAIDNFRVIRDVPPPVQGDYNENGIVDAADYVVWRNNIGMNTIPNDPTPGEVDDSDYTFWRSRFGAISGSGSAAGLAATTVPEPTTLCIGLVALLGGLMTGSRGRARD